MRINNTDGNQAGFKGRIGRFDVDSEKIFKKMYNGMNYWELKRIKDKMQMKEQAIADSIKKPFVQRISEFFAPLKADAPEEVNVFEKLKQDWQIAGMRMKNLVIDLLPDEYVLRCRKTDLSPDSMDFIITNGREDICGVSATLGDPGFAAKNMEKAVGIMSDPEYAKNFKGMKRIVQGLTENTYIVDHEKFSSPDVLKWLETNDQLAREAKRKGVEFFMNLSKDEYWRYNKIIGGLRKGDEVLYFTSAQPGEQEEFMDHVRKALMIRK